MMSLQTLALQADQLMKEYQAGNISADEYKELINTMNMVQIVNEQTASLEENIQYRDIILAAINIAVALA